MIKIDFSKVLVKQSFEGDATAIDFRKPLANRIHQTTGDIGFDDFAHKLYFSEGEIEVPEEYIQPLKDIIKENYVAYVQRAFNEMLTKE